jgi:chromosome segregation ATPase
MENSNNNNFKLKLYQCFELVNQVEIQEDLIKSFQNSIKEKCDSLEKELKNLKSVFLEEDELTILEKMNQIKHLEILIDEKDETIKELNSELRLLNDRLNRKEDNKKNEYYDDLPF